MTVSIIEPRVVLSYTGPGDYSFLFPILEEGFIDVSHRDTDGSVTQLAISVDYTVTLNPDTTGDVNLTYDSPAGGPYTGDIIIERVIPIDQQVDWVNGGPLDMELLERTFDRLTMIAQQLKNTIDIGTSAFNWRGNWTTDTFYSVNELVVGGGTESIYIATADHTSGDFATDVANGLFELLIDVNTVAEAVGILDEDDFISNSATEAPSQQSTDVYVRNTAIPEETTGKQTIWVPASSMTLPVTAASATPAIMSSGSPQTEMSVLDFNSGVVEQCYFQIALPKGWDVSVGLTFAVYSTSSGTGSGIARWQLHLRAYDDQNDLTVSTGSQTAVEDGYGGIDLLRISLESSPVQVPVGGPSPGDLITFRLLRHGAHANDNMPGVVRLIGIKVFFTTNSITDD